MHNLSMLDAYKIEDHAPNNVNEIYVTICSIYITLNRR